MKNKIFVSLLRILGYAILALVIVAIPQGIWGGLLFINLALSPNLPWSVIVMAGFLGIFWLYLSGKGWPRSTAQLRHSHLRANPVSVRVLAWTLLVGILSVVALTGYWIVAFQLFKMQANLLPDISKYPLSTLVPIAIMASLVSPLCEEAALRGYFQVHLEKSFRLPAAIILSAILFSLIHVTQGLYLPKLAIYFLAGLVFGNIAAFTNSILATIPVHIIADLTFFILVWPYDPSRRLVWNGGADPWFWIHVAQAIIFTILAVVAFRQLKKETDYNIEYSEQSPVVRRSSS